MIIEMHLKNALAIAKKNLLILSHDKRTVALLIFMPILMMVLFGYAFGQPVEHVPIKVVNLDTGGVGVPLFGFNDTYFSDIAISFIYNDPRVDITLIPEEEFILDEEKDRVYGGDDYFALVIIPVDFTENMVNITYAINMTVYIDGSDPQTIGSVQSAIAEMVGEVMNSLSEGAAHLSIDMVYIAGNPDLRPIDTMAAGILSYSLLLFMILTVTGGFTKERITGTIYRVMTTPTTKGDVIMGYLIGNSLIALVQSSILLLIAIFIFNLSVVGSVFLLYGILFLFAMNCVGLGIFASAFAETELQSFQFIPLLLIPAMFFSGFMFPIRAFPEIFQYISNVIPMTYSIRISRAIMINGFGIDMFIEDFLWLLGLTVVYILAAIKVFRVRK